MAQDPPTVAELVAASAEHLQGQVLPAIGDPALSDLTLQIVEALKSIEPSLAADRSAASPTSEKQLATWSEQLVHARTQIKAALLPGIADPGLRFRTLVAANVLAIAERQLNLAPAQREAELQRLRILLADDEQLQSLEAMGDRLWQRVAAGDYDQGAGRQALLEHLKQTAVDKLEIANPKLLDRLAEEGR